MQKMNYLTMMIVTRPLLASNARGEGNGGNGQTLQHVTTQFGDLTVASGYALRYAIRAAMEDAGVKMWRKRNSSQSASGFAYGPDNEATMAAAPPKDQFDYADTAAFAYMIAAKGSGDKAVKARSAVELSDAISTTAYDGGVGFAQGHKAADGELNPFTYERHYTRYQYSVTINLGQFRERNHLDYLKPILDALAELQVGGNQAAHAATFVPAIIAWRFHDTPGKGGLFVGFDQAQVWSPDQKIDLAPLQEVAKDLGFDFEVGGKSVSDLSIREALDQIWAQVQG